MEHDPQPLRLSLELRPRGAALCGSLRDEGGTEHEFTGWLGLLTLLEDARLRAQPVSIAA
ncbi:MAG TPA: hypothetical protein VF529_14425 [Solirubrobacteraceae bacterium]|jgi:hypothetical protein